MMEGGETRGLGVCHSILLHKKKVKDAVWAIGSNWQRIGHGQPSEWKSTWECSIWNSEGARKANIRQWGHSEESGCCGTAEHNLLQFNPSPVADSGNFMHCSGALMESAQQNSDGRARNDEVNGLIEKVCSTQTFMLQQQGSNPLTYRFLINRVKALMWPEALPSMWLFTN